MTASENSDYGNQRYGLSRKKGVVYSEKIKVTADNQYIDEVEMEAKLISYDILRLQIKGKDTDQF